MLAITWDPCRIMWCFQFAFSPLAIAGGHTCSNPSTDELSDIADLCLYLDVVATTTLDHQKSSATAIQSLDAKMTSSFALVEAQAKCTRPQPLHPLNEGSSSQTPPRFHWSLPHNHHLFIRLSNRHCVLTLRTLRESKLRSSLQSLHMIMGWNSCSLRG